jgi:hypothetical protein
MAKARSDYNAASPAGITDDTGNQLIGADTAGAQAFIMGAPLIREVQAGVANGDFAAPPADAAATITADNPLPYWTFTDVNSAGAITCAVVADTGNASGNILRWSVAGGTTTGKSATLTRYVIVPGSRNREFVFIPEMTLLNATASTAINVTIGFTWYKSDGTTTTGTGNTTSTSNTFTVIGAGPTTIAASSSAVNTAIPASAAFMLITITVATTGTVSAGTKTVDLAEVRIASGQSDVYVAENTTPGTYGPSRFRQANGTLTLSPNLGGSGAFAVSGNQTISGTLGVTGAATMSSTLDVTGAVTTGTIDATGTITTTGNLRTNGADVFIRATSTENPTISFEATNGTVRATIVDNGTNTLFTGQNFGNVSLQLFTLADTTVPNMVIGGLGIITTGGTRYLYAGDSGGADYRVSLSSASDRRLKQNIENYNDGLSRVIALRPVKYKWKEAPEAGYFIGLLADEVEEIEPLLSDIQELKSDDPRRQMIPDGQMGILEISGTEALAVAASAIKELSQKVNELEERLAALE